MRPVGTVTVLLVTLVSSVMKVNLHIPRDILKMCCDVLNVCCGCSSSTGGEVH